VLRGKSTDKTRQHGHEALSTFGIGAHVPESQWRGVLRQLIALGHLRAAGEYGTLALEPSAREVLRGQVRLLLRVPADPAPARKAARSARAGRTTPAATASAAAALDAQGQARLAALKAWRAGVAREHGLPAYVIFHDATLVQMAHECPQTLAALAAIGGVGAKKLQAYGEAILQELAPTHTG
jgi:ATP-dependent DNA helicase RecQ